jgi:hypothetical protein
MIPLFVAHIGRPRGDEVPSLRSDSGKSDPISFGRMTRDSRQGDANDSGIYHSLSALASGGNDSSLERTGVAKGAG